MRMLRETIRSMLLESQNVYQKLMVLFNGEPESIRQAIELAIGAGMIKVLSRDREYATGTNEVIGNRIHKYEKVTFLCLDHELAKAILNNRVPRKRYTYWSPMPVVDSTDDREFHLTFRYTEPV